MSATLLLPAQQMPLVDSGGRVTVPWYQFFTSLIAGQSGIGDLLVNPGTGDNSRTLNQVLADLANVNDYLSVGDTNYDGAIGRCLAARGRAWFPNKPWLGGASYPTATRIVLLDGQGLRGDGPGLSVVSCRTPSEPAVALGQNIQNFGLAELSVVHGGAAATAGGDGLHQGQGLTDWVNNGTVSNVIFDKNYVGMNLGKAFYCRVDNVSVSNSVSRGVAMTSAGVSTVPSGAAGGPLQWYFSNAAVGANGGDGFAYISTATTPTTISVGALTACTTFANAGHGVAAYGNANAGIYAVRIFGGFYGQDNDHEIYLDSYGNHHSIRPDMIELAGNGAAGSATATGVYVTANNNAQTYVAVPQINGCNADGVLTQAAGTQVLGGFITNNGLSLTASRRNGVNFFGVAGQVLGALLADTGAAAQQYGVAGNVAGVQLVGCDLRANVTAPTALPTFVGDTTTLIDGCNPLNLNQVYADQLHVYGAAAFLGSGGTAGTLGISVLAGGMNFTAGVGGNGLTVDNATFRVSAGVQTPASGVTGQFDAPTVKVSTDLATTGTATTHLTAGAIAMSGGITIVSGGMNFTATGANGINAADNVTIRTSLGVGAAASGTAGRVDLAASGGVIVGSPTGGFKANGINLTDAYYINGVAIVGFSGTYTGNVTFTGDLTVTGQTKTQDLWVTRSMGLAAAPDGTSAHFTGPGGGIAFSGGLNVNVTGALAVTGATTLTGGASLGSDIGMGTHNITNAGTISANSTITGGAGLVLSGSITGATSISMSGALSGATSGAFSTNVTVSGDITTGTLHSGASAFTGGMTIVSGGVAITGGINVDNIAMTGGLYNPAATGTFKGAGTINVATNIFLNNVAYNNP